ncbi:MAG: hypothetical protein ACYCS7_13940, partial [Acidimicrobiales bacterium]
MMNIPFRSSGKPQPFPTTLVATREVTGTHWSVPSDSHDTSMSLVSSLSSARFDIRLTAAGVSVGPSGGSRGVAPTLVPWSHLRGLSAEHCTEATDGSTGQILEIVSDDPTDAGVSQVRRFLVSALDLVVFFR